jgi:hypothetical protein
MLAVPDYPLGRVGMCLAPPPPVPLHQNTLLKNKQIQFEISSMSDLIGEIYLVLWYLLRLHLRFALLPQRSGMWICKIC